MKRKDKIPANGDELPIRNSTAEFLIFAKDSGANTISVRFQDKMLWLTLQLIADLFDVDKSVVSRHLTNIFSQGELSPEGTVAKFATVRQEGSRQVERQLEYYNLEEISAEIAQAKAIGEYEKFRVRQELEYKNDFDRQLDLLEEQARQANGEGTEEKP